MTVIAFDGKTLAADKQATNGSTKIAVSKIFRHGQLLTAICGDLSDGMETLMWWKAGAVDADYPKANRGDSKGASLIVIHPDGSVFKYESSPIPFMVEGKFCAFGDGDEAALIAMECGADAVRAVELVCKYNASCGVGVDSLQLNP